MKPLRRFAPGEEIDPASGPLGIRVVASSQLADGEPAAFSFVESDETPPPAPALNGARPLEIDYGAALRRLMGARFGPLDLMLIDLASGLSQLHCLAEVIELTGIVMVTRPSEACVRATHDALKTIAHDGIAVLGLVENMLGFNCDSCHSVRPLFPQGNFAGLAQSSEAPILGRLPFDPRLADCAERGALFVREYPDAPLTKQFAAIAANLEQQIARRTSVAVAPPTTATACFTEEPAGALALAVIGVGKVHRRGRRGQATVRVFEHPRAAKIPGKVSAMTSDMISDAKCGEAERGQDSALRGARPRQHHEALDLAVNMTCA